MHKAGVGLKREEIVKQVENQEASVKDYSNYIPIGNSVKKLESWKKQGAKVFYLTSRKSKTEIAQIKKVLKKYYFPEGELLFRKTNEDYKDVAERIMPDILIEDDCESIGGIKEMTITNVKPEIKKRIKSLAIKEFGGIDNLPDKLDLLYNYKKL